MILILFLMLMISSNCYADTKISAMTLDSAPTTDNLTVEVDDPSGTPVNKKITLGSIANLSGFTDNGTTVSLSTSSDNIGIGTSDAYGGRLIITDGNVGIGTLTSARYLSVFSPSVSVARFQSTAAYAGGAGTNNILFNSDTGAAITGGNKFITLDFAAARDAIHTIGNAAAITAYTTEDWSGSATGSRLDFETTNNGSTTRTARLSITNQNIGIGTGNPQATLAIIKNATTPAFQISSVAGGGGDYLKVDSTGNVGLGSTAAGQKLDVQGTVRMTGFIDTTSPTNGYIMTTDANGNGTWQAAGSQWATQNTTDVSLAGGNVGIGTTFTTTSALTIMNGNVGIGTWKPTSALMVRGGVMIGSAVQTAPSSGLATVGNVGIGTSVLSRGTLEVIQSVDSSSGGIGLANTAKTGSIRMWVDSNNISRVDGASGGTTRILLNGAGAGNVGIGTVDPQALLDLGVNGTLRSNRTTGIGWSVKTGANTACNTTCGASACVFGEDTSVVGTIVGCTDATADVCVCAGP